MRRLALAITIGFNAASAAGLGVWQYLSWTDKTDPIGAWSIPIGLALGVGLGASLGHLLTSWIKFRLERRLERYRGMQIDVEQDEEGNAVLLASNENFATTLKLPEGYHPSMDGGARAMRLLADELGLGDVSIEGIRR